MNYERLTKSGGIRLVFIENVAGQEQTEFEINGIKQSILYNRLAELEDKIESGELVEKTELDKALAEKQERGQDLTVKTIFRYTEEIKALKTENEDLKFKLKKLWEITDKYIARMENVIPDPEKFTEKGKGEE